MLQDRNCPFGVRDEHRVGLGAGMARQRAHPSLAGLVLWRPADGHPERACSSPLESVPQRGGHSRESFSTRIFRACSVFLQMSSHCGNAAWAGWRYGHWEDQAPAQTLRGSLLG